MIYVTAIIYLLGGLSYYECMCVIATVGESIDELSESSDQEIDSLGFMSTQKTRKFMWLILLLWPGLFVAGKLMRLTAWMKG